MNMDAAHRELLMRVSDRLVKTHSATDHFMLTKWRVLTMCQHLLGGPASELESACVAALQAFAAHGAGAASDKALAAAAGVLKFAEGRSDSVLPSISRAKRVAVKQRLDSLTMAGGLAIESALGVVGQVRKRMSATSDGMSLPGIRHRFELVVAILENIEQTKDVLSRAAAAVLYVDEISDVVSEELGVIGMLDGDYALRVVLDEVAVSQGDEHLHWSERISSLWDDLPFLQGVNLRRHDASIPVTWLDRVNSYVSYSHVLGVEKAPLVLLQPSIVCSPLHAIVSLIGLLVLDALTTVECKAQTLRVGQVYEIDGFFARFEGMAGPPMPGWLKLRWSDSIHYQPPALADRMLPVERGRLSSGRKFSSRVRASSADPMQRFFDWDSEIVLTSISSRLVLVASRQRALNLLEGVQSNGVRLLDHGLVRFVGANPEELETQGTLILVVPSLSIARFLLDRGVRMQAILVDGYARLHRGRHELPFLINRKGAPPIVNWSATGYYPAEPPTWLPPHKRLEVSSTDLASILELDDSGADLSHASLWEAATGATVRPRMTCVPPHETVVLSAIDAYANAIRSSEELPEYWRYHLTALARTLRLLITSTPAEWAEVQRFASAWSSSIDGKWASLRDSAVVALSGLRSAEKHVIKILNEVSEMVNSRATELLRLLSEGQSNDQWCFVCDRAEQVKVAGAFLRAREIRNVEPALLHDVAVCGNCVIAGWVSSSFARRLWAHTPRLVVALVDANERQRWNRAADAHRQPAGQSMLSAIGGATVSEVTGVVSLAGVRPDMESEEFEADAITSERRPCIFLWVAGETEAKVLARDSRVIFEDGDVIRERNAAQLQPDDRVILGAGTSRWSPADEFTDAVVEAVETSNPQLVKQAREWRRALQRVRDDQQLSTTQVRALLASVGVQREEQTIEGWLDLEHASPIAPRGVRLELSNLWPIIAQRASCSLEEIAGACERLRMLRTASGRALVQLWRGKASELGINDDSITTLVDRLRQEVHVYEVEAVTLGDVPHGMFGWWVPPTVASYFESDTPHAEPMSVAPEDWEALGE